VKTPDPPADVTDGVYTAVEPDGRVKLIMARRRKAIANVTLPANETGHAAAKVLEGAFDAWDQAVQGLVPEGARKDSYSFVRITGLGLGPCPLEGHACLVVRVGATELGFAFPREKLRQFAQRVVEQELPEK
jgi:hypothetical protein